jgi:putative nucleotidyltransferase with HDIG domain
MKPLDEFVKQIKTLPPGPRVLSQLLSALGKPDIDASEVVRLISFDPALTSKLLQRCNTAVYGQTQPVYDLDQAVVRLGFNQIYRMVATVVAETALSSPQRGYGIEAGALWEHSAATAVAARLMARYYPADENLLFTAALLHDIGKLILSAYLEGKYELIVSETESSGFTLLETEKTLLGVEHAELGGRILAEWNFPESLVSTVRWHHAPMEAAPFEHLAAAIHLADLIAHLAGHSQGHQSFAVHADDSPAALLGVTERDLESLVLETEANLAETKLFQRRPA